MSYPWLVVLIISYYSHIVLSTNLEELLLQDPSLWPGHLEPFGTKQPTAEIEVIDYWPEPVDFFKEYVDKSKPVLFKGMAKQSPAYILFDDEYLRTFDGADTAMIYAEPEKKENRTKKGYHMSMKEFIERYHKENLYLVNSLPNQLNQHVRMPPPIRCNETRPLIKLQVAWMSSGGTKSVLHNDNIDNINCLYRGTKQLWMIEYTKNKQYIPLDRPEGAYSSLDVDKVNYTKYPDLRKVDTYYQVDMNEGDCLFIPYLWVHQVNSVANEREQNLAVNVWFDHEIDHRPKQCDISERDATMDKYRFYLQDLEEETKEEDVGKETEESDKGNNSIDEIYDLLHRIIGRSKKKSISIKTFLKILYKSPLSNVAGYKMKRATDEYVSLGKKFFGSLDVNGDGILTEEDIVSIKSIDDEEDEFHLSMERHLIYVTTYFRDLKDEADKEALLDEADATSPADDATSLVEETTTPVESTTTQMESKKEEL